MSRSKVQRAREKAVFSLVPAQMAIVFLSPGSQLTKLLTALPHSLYSSSLMAGNEAWPDGYAPETAY